MRCAGGGGGRGIKCVVGHMRDECVESWREDARERRGMAVRGGGKRGKRGKRGMRR